MVIANCCRRIVCVSGLRVGRIIALDELRARLLLVLRHPERPRGIVLSGARLNSARAEEALGGPDPTVLGYFQPGFGMR